MMKITSNMILCELLNYHIICPFPVVQIRFPAKMDISIGNRKGSKRLARTVLIFTERSDQLSRATDRVPDLPASPGYAQ
ncbi:hypothetical protein DUQ67_18470 [Salmonella enterica subsp. enterica serovar Irumu]|nr:hypothetical protein [Salmonella enterica subsp. enterica serovar Irumu]